MEGSGGDGYDYGVVVVVEEGCRTPRHEGCRIPAAAAEACPPAPRKKRIYTKQRSLPKDGYFQHPDIELFFAMMSRRERYVQLQACLEAGPGSACY